MYVEELMDLTDREKQLICERDQLSAENQELLKEKSKSEEEFGKIRARFKDLYLQREAEIISLNDEKAKLESEMADIRTAALISQNTAQEEIDQLSRRHGEEIRHYKQEFEVIKGRARNESVVSTRNNDNEEGPANLESDMIRAKKDADMLKNIIVPLETELKEVKLECQKLMSENMRLREKESNENRPQPTVDMLLDLCDDVTAGAEVAVEVDYQEQVKELEAAFEALQVENRDLNEQSLSERSQLALLASSLKHTQEELTVKTTELEELKRSVQTTESKWGDLTNGFSEKIGDIDGMFKGLRESQDGLKTELQGDIEKHTSEMIELRNFKQKLEEQFDKLKGKLNDERKTHEDAQALLTDSLESCRQQIFRLEGISEELQSSREMNDKLQQDIVTMTDKLGESQRKSKEVILELQRQIINSDSEKNQLQEQIIKLGKDLNESLSVRDELAIQSSELQVQMESQRELIKSIRWEHEDDVTSCRGCDVTFTMTKRKSHCRKCGHIFCADCCSRTLEMGDTRRLYKACEDCSERHKNDQPTEYHTVSAAQN